MLSFEEAATVEVSLRRSRIRAHALLVLLEHPHVHVTQLASLITTTPVRVRQAFEGEPPAFRLARALGSLRLVRAHATREGVAYSLTGRGEWVARELRREADKWAVDPARPRVLEPGFLTRAALQATLGVAP